MKKIKTTNIFLTAFTGILLVIAILILTYDPKPANKVEKVVKEDPVTEPIKKNAVEVNTETEEPVEEEPEVEPVAEDYVIRQIHAMTHQKVLADDKWYSVEMTQENIETLLAEVKASDNLVDKDLYIAILEAWERGDFRNVLGTHNTMWEKQGGTVGKAYGYMTEEEEKLFIEQHFR